MTCKHDRVCFPKRKLIQNNSLKINRGKLARKALNKTLSFLIDNLFYFSFMSRHFLDLLVCIMLSLWSIWVTLYLWIVKMFRRELQNSLDFSRTRVRATVDLCAEDRVISHHVVEFSIPQTWSVVWSTRNIRNIKQDFLFY